MLTHPAWDEELSAAPILAKRKKNKGFFAEK
jgi:hypothetical protein